MGKQKSYIMVGSVFLGFIFLMLLVTIISNNVKKTKVSFDSEVYYVEIGKTRALTPTIFAGGKVLEGVTFSYEAENASVVKLEAGCYSFGTSLIDCWVFYESDANGNPVEKTTVTPYVEGDVVTVEKDSAGKLYWHVNGVKTRAAANKEYTEEEISKMGGKKENYADCFYLNGEPTKIPYDSKVTPVRNEQTGTWFINGKDTGVEYKSIPTSITGVEIGSTKITAKATIDGEEFELSATIYVCEPDPTALESNAVDSTIIVNVNQEFSVDYKVVGKSEYSDPLQTVLLSTPSGLTQNNGVYIASSIGEYRINVTVAESSFRFDQPKTLNKAVKVIVVDVDSEQLELINAAREAISAIGTLVNTDECKARYEVAASAVEKVLEANVQYITNYRSFEAAKNMFSAQE